MTTYFKHFESMGELIARAADETIKANWKKRTSRRDTDTKWSGSRDFAEAVEWANKGWPEGRAKMHKAAASAATAGAVMGAPAYFHDVGGAYPVAALAAAGDPCCMMNFAPVSERTRPVVRIWINISASSFMKASELFNYGAGLVAYVDGLEQNDIQAEIALVSVQYSGSQKGVLSAIVKQAGEILDQDRIAFAIACPAMYRRIFFSIMEQELPAKGFEHGYGYPGTPEVGKDIPHDVTFLPSAQEVGQDKLKTPQDAFRNMAPIIEKALRERNADLPPLSFEEA